MTEWCTLDVRAFEYNPSFKKNEKELAPSCFTQKKDMRVFKIFREPNPYLLKWIKSRSGRLTDPNPSKQACSRATSCKFLRGHLQSLEVRSLPMASFLSLVTWLNALSSLFLFVLVGQEAGFLIFSKKMAKFSLQPNNFCSLSHTPNTHNSFFKVKNQHLNLFPSKRSLKFRVLCSVKEKENAQKGERVSEVISGVRVDKSEQRSPNTDSDSREVDFNLNWPPWKNIPQRYKLIGTTSLAFVICNMDKVNLCYLSLKQFNKHFTLCSCSWINSVSGWLNLSGR